MELISHDLTILFCLPSSKSRIITFGLNNFSGEVAILILAANKHKNELRPLEIVTPIQLVTCDGKKRAIGSSVVIGSDSLQPRVDFRDWFLTIGSHSGRFVWTGSIRNRIESRLDWIMAGLMNLGQIVTRLEKTIHGEIAAGVSGHLLPEKKQTPENRSQSLWETTLIPSRKLGIFLYFSIEHVQRRHYIC